MLCNYLGVYLIVKKRLKVYLGIIYIGYLLTLIYSWNGFYKDQVITTIGLVILIYLFNSDVVRDLQSDLFYLIIRPFTIVALVYLQPFYAMVFLSSFLLIISRKHIWYKRIFNSSAASMALFISTYFFHYFYQNFDAGAMFTTRFFVILLIAIFLNILLESSLIFIVASLEKGKIDTNIFITLITIIKTNMLTLFLGLINVILFYYTNLIGVAVFTFLVYFIKPALQYREIFDNELSTYTNFVLIILKQMDPVTHSHSERVKFWTVLMAKKMKLSAAEVRQLSQAASWHDVGKIEIPFHIINKPGKLTDEEYDLVKNHPDRGYELVKELHFFKKFLPVIRYHHERYDGAGYPTGLKGEEIPLHARIMTITDAFDAMTSDRSYRMGMEMKDAVAELSRYAGTQFDPKLVNIFIEALKEEYGQSFEKYNKEIIMNVG